MENSDQCEGCPLNIAVQVISAAKLLNQLPDLPLQAVIRRIFPFQAWSMNRT